MDSPQSVVSPFKASSAFAGTERHNADHFVNNLGCFSRLTEVPRKEAAVCNLEDFLGVLDVFIHQARDIHNICIYHKQDVYAKLYLTSDPENTLSTQTINGGGKNPVFNENIRLNVRTIDSSVKCEIWMLSRVRNYLEDQLLGFALVPLSEVLLKNGKLDQEFSLSSTDLYHSPAGFIHLSLSYSGASPEVMAISKPSMSVATDAAAEDNEVPASILGELDKIEFPDPKIMNENDMMVSEYIGMTCSNSDSHSSESLVSADTENYHSSKVGPYMEESFSTGNIYTDQIPKHDSPPSSVSTNGSPFASLPLGSQSSESPSASKYPSEEYVSPLKEKSQEKAADVGDSESNGSGEVTANSFSKPVVTVNIEPEQKVVQQDIVDMYMKSMQQFTESLAKMKLPLDIASEPTSSGNSSSDQKLQTPKSTGSRVFYGSRAFF